MIHFMTLKLESVGWNGDEPLHPLWVSVAYENYGATIYAFAQWHGTQEELFEMAKKEESALMEWILGAIDIEHSDAIEALLEDGDSEVWINGIEVTQNVV